MITINGKSYSPSNFWTRHKKKIVIATLAVTTAGTALMFRNQHEYNKFLREHDLFDEFYKTPEIGY